MNKKVNWHVTDQNIIVNYDGETHIVSRGDALADKLVKALKESRLNDIPALVSASKRIETYSKGKFTVVDGRVMVNGVAAPDFLSGRILRFSNEGLPVEPLVKFAEKLQMNPSFRAVQELFQFLEKNNHPITETGNFIAYKKVRADFKDAYSGTFDNSPGCEPSMPRNEVNEDPTQTCSDGLHVANWDYAHNTYSAGAGSNMLEVEVNPADVVAVPVDYNQSKMRVCKYKVLAVVEQPHEDGKDLRLINPDYTEYEEEEEEEEECANCGSTICDGDLCEEDTSVDTSGELCNCSECTASRTDEYPYRDELDQF